MVNPLTVGLAVWAACMTWLAWRWHRDTQMPALKCLVLLNFTHSENSALRGVLFARHGEYLLLKQVTLVHGDGTTAIADGDVLIDRARVAFLQVLPPA
jgi:hypothetical protein